MHLLLSFTLAMAAPQTPNVAPAPPTRREKHRQKRLRERHIDFDDPLAIKGDLAGPFIDIHIDRPLPVHPPLFNLREDFSPELEQSAHFVR